MRENEQMLVIEFFREVRMKKRKMDSTQEEDREGKHMP